MGFPLSSLEMPRSEPARVFECNGLIWPTTRDCGGRILLMEPIKHTITERLPILRLYREDLDQLLAIFRSRCAKVTISDKENRYESLDEMKTYVGGLIKDLDIRGESPYVHFLLNQSEVVSGSPSTRIFYYNELRTEELSDDAEMLFYKLRDFLLQHRAPKLRPSYLIGALIGAISCILFLYVDREVFRRGQISLGFLISLLTTVGAIIASALGGNELRLETRVNSPSYWKRNKESFITTAVTSTIGGIVGYLIGRFLK